MSETSIHFQGKVTFNYYLNNNSVFELKKWGVNIIRIGLEIDEVENAEIMQDYLDTIDMLLDNNMYVLTVLWNNENINTNMEIARKYFELLSQRYKDTPNIIYEIANEPDRTVDWEMIKTYSNEIIPTIRSNDTDNIIIIPNPNYDNRPNEVNLNDITNNSNVMTSYHMYVGSNLTQENISYLQQAIDKNIPVFVTEWGTTLSNGNEGFFEEYSNAFVKYMENNKLSWCNFHIGDKNFLAEQGEGNEEYSGIVKHNMWDNSLNDNILTDSGKYIKNILLGTCSSYNNNSCAIMIERNDNNAFWQEEYRNRIKKIQFKKESEVPDEALIQWDISMFNDKTIMAYIMDNNKEYELYIISNTIINFPISSISMFEDFAELETISFDNIKTSTCIQLSYLFRNNTNLQSIEGISNFDTSNVQWMYGIFQNCANLNTIDLSGWNLENVYGISNAFAACNRLKEIKGIETWNTSSLVECNSIFQECFSLESLDLKNWNMQRVTKIAYGFFNMRSLKNLYLNNVELNINDLDYSSIFGDSDYSNTNIYVKDLSIAKFIMKCFNEYGNVDVPNIYYGTEGNWTEYTS